MTDDSAAPPRALTTLAVLAGGEGRRMGGPKGALALDGRPILERLLDRLAWPGPTLLVTAPGRRRPPGWRRFAGEATDPVAGDGPLRGILTALENAPTNDVVVIPVDMPNLTPAPLAWLAARLQDHPSAVAVMAQQSGRIEPLPAAFRVSTARNFLRARLSNRQLALHSLSDSPRVVVVSAPRNWPGDFWVNLNTPSDLENFSIGRTRAAVGNDRSLESSSGRDKVNRAFRTHPVRGKGRSPPGCGKIL
jgi:molybdenum cofactor guanylyltransferase